MQYEQRFISNCRMQSSSQHVSLCWPRAARLHQVVLAPNARPQALALALCVQPLIHV